MNASSYIRQQNIAYEISIFVSTFSLNSFLLFLQMSAVRFDISEFSGPQSPQVRIFVGILLSQSA